MAKLQCRFCMRKIVSTKYVRHNCNNKKKAKAYYEDWQHEHRDDNITLNRYPTFEAWDLGILDGTLYYPSYPYCPPGISADADGQPDLDSNSDTPADDFGNEGLIIEPGNEWVKPDNVAKPVNSHGSGLIRPSDLDNDSWKPQEDEEEEDGIQKPSLKSTADNIIATGIDVAKNVKEAFRISAKEKAWLPVVAGAHELLMWAFEAKDRKAYFKLSRAQKKILTASYQATFGDSPFLKLKTTGTGEYDVHVVVANIEVYGEFIMENAEGGISRGGKIWTKMQKRLKASKKAKKERELQEEEFRVEEEGQGTKEWPR